MSYGITDSKVRDLKILWSRLSVFLQSLMLGYFWAAHSRPLESRLRGSPLHSELTVLPCMSSSVLDLPRALPAMTALQTHQWTISSEEHDGPGGDSQDQFSWHKSASVFGSLLGSISHFLHVPGPLPAVIVHNPLLADHASSAQPFMGPFTLGMGTQQLKWKQV